MRSPDPLVTELRDRRKRMRISQERLSQRRGLTSTTLSRIENGHHGPSLFTLQAIAGELGMRVCLRPVEVGHAAGESTAYERARREVASGR